MAALLWAGVAVALGCLLAIRQGGFGALAGPRWARVLLTFGAGAAAGMGVTSTLFWLGRAALGLPAAAAMAAELTLAGVLAWTVYRRPSAPAPAFPSSPAFPARAALAAAAAATAAMALAAAWQMSASIPHGHWDAWAIWNLRARFLAAPGDLPERAWSCVLSHASYPQLLPGFIARCWAFSGTSTPAAPAVAGMLFWTALLAMGVGGLALLRGTTLALLFGCAFAAAPVFLGEVASQYADVPLACYMAGAVMLALLGRPTAAGLFAGLAAWTKDEGLLFAVAFLAMAALFRRGWLRAAASAAPLIGLALWFKLVVAGSSSSTLALSLPGLYRNAADPARYWPVLAAFAARVREMSLGGWYHPLFPVVILAVLLRFDRRHLRDLLFASAIFAAMLGGYFAAYVTTPYDQTWHLASS